MEQVKKQWLILSLNQVGYRPGDVKTLFVRGLSSPGEPFEILDEVGLVRYAGTLEEAVFDEDLGERVFRGDFSAVRGEGLYQARVGDQLLSFPVGEDVYGELQKSLLKMLTMQRCGCALSEKDGGAFAHAACHREKALIYGSDQRIDVSGGWHDAGDYGRYVVAGAKAVADLLIACESFGCDRNDLGIPESGSDLPDLLNEARYELEWLLKMQRSDGAVYHKVTGYGFPGMISPDEDDLELVLSPVSDAATADAAAVFAMGARIYASFDQAFSDRLKEAALASFAWVRDQETLTGFHNPKEIVTGEYPDETPGDELFWAAAEMALLGEDTLEILERSAGRQLGAGLGWEDVSGYGLYALAFHEDLLGEPYEDLIGRALERLVREAELLLSRSALEGYHTAFGGEYVWGSNMVAANQGMLLLMAGKLTGSAAFVTCAKEQADYLLGANPLSLCFVTGAGSVSPVHPHHRPSAAAGQVMPGMLVGGPDASLEDPEVQKCLKGRPASLCYLDSLESYSTNEITIYWNSALIALLAGLEEK